MNKIYLIRKMEVTKIYCDRCNKELKNKKVALIIDLLKGNMFHPIQATFFTHIELCLKCLNNFKYFMKGGK